MIVLNHYRLEAGRLKSRLEAAKHSKEYSSLRRDVAFVTRFVRIDRATDGGMTLSSVTTMVKTMWLPWLYSVMAVCCSNRLAFLMI